MYKRLFTTLLVVMFALGPVCGQAQQDRSAAQSKKAQDQALRQKAFDLLESLAGELGTLQSPENRARLGSNIAGSLWPHNEHRARELFAQVREDINKGLQVPENPDNDDTKTLQVFLKLRADTIERIVKYDPELAYSFFKATELSSDKELPADVRGSEYTLESHLAKQIIASNPNMSLELARRILARDFDDNLRSLLARLNRKHKEQAKVLYKEIVDKLADADLTQNWNARFFALNLANSFPPHVVDASTFRELVNVFIKVMTENGCNRKLTEEDEAFELCSGFAMAIPLIAKVDPSRASKLQHWVNDGAYYSPTSPYSEAYDLLQDASVDDMLALIAEYPQMEGEIRIRALHKAERDGDQERARKIVSDYTSDPERQRMMLEFLNRKQARASVVSEQIEEIQKRISQRPASTQVVALAVLSLQVADNDRKLATKLLNQATEMMDTLKPGKEQTQAVILLATIHSNEKSNRGLAIIESHMPKLNELVASAVKLDGYDTHYLRDGEWNMTGEGELGSLLTWLSLHAAYFAWFDFDRAVSVAGQFERPEIRMMAQLKLAQAILAGPPKRFEMDYDRDYLH